MYLTSPIASQIIVIKKKRGTQLHVLFYKEQVLDFMLEALLFGIRITMVRIEWIHIKLLGH